MSPVSIRLLLTQSDARLLAFARAGHERAFEALVQRYRRQLLGYCRRLLLSDERAEDALQQALLQAWLALRAGTEVSDVKPWLYRIVHNAALNMLRVSGYNYCELHESLYGADAPEADLDRRIAIREALAGLAALPTMQREALLRTAIQGHPHQQVARDLGLSETALRGLVYRARATLRTAASAITPPQLLSWALQSPGASTPVLERFGEVGVGGGSAGLAGLLMKGGAVALTAGVLAGQIASERHHHTAMRTDTPVRAGAHVRYLASVSPRAQGTIMPSARPQRSPRRPSSVKVRHGRAARHSPGLPRRTDVALADPATPLPLISRPQDSQQDGGGIPPNSAQWASATPTHVDGAGGGHGGTAIESAAQSGRHNGPDEGSSGNEARTDSSQAQGKRGDHSNGKEGSSSSTPGSSGSSHGGSSGSSETAGSSEQQGSRESSSQTSGSSDGGHNTAWRNQESGEH